MGDPIAGVVIDFGSAGTATTDAQGRFSKTLSAGWTGAVTPQGGIFSPDHVDLTNLHASVNVGGFVLVSSTTTSTTTSTSTTTETTTTTTTTTTPEPPSSFTDDLDRANESPVGSPYYHISESGGALNLASTTLRQDYDSEHTAYAQGEARYATAMSSANGHLEFGYDMTNASVSDNFVGCFGRLNDHTAHLGVAGMNCYWFRTYGSTDSAHRQILRCQGATIDLLAQDTGGSASGTFVAEWNGTSLSLDDGVGGSPLTTTDSTITDGKYWGVFTHMNGSGSGYVEILPNIAYTTPA